MQLNHIRLLGLMVLFYASSNYSEELTPIMQSGRSVGLTSRQRLSKISSHSSIDSKQYETPGLFFSPLKKNLDSSKSSSGSLNFARHVNARNLSNMPGRKAFRHSKSSDVIHNSVNSDSTQQTSLTGLLGAIRKRNKPMQHGDLINKHRTQPLQSRRRSSFTSSLKQPKNSQRSAKAENPHKKLHHFRGQKRSHNETPERAYRLQNRKFINTTKDACPPSCKCEYQPNQTVEIIDCSNRKLTHIPPLPSPVKEIYLQGNKILHVSCSSFRNLKHLTKLDLSRNSFTQLPGCSFADLTSLNHLWLSQCGLTGLDTRLYSHLRKLLGLDLSKNNLTKIRNNTFQGLDSLERLNLQGNMLRYQPWTFETRAFHGLTSLTHLHLEGNQPDLPDDFTYPDQALSHVPTLEYLWLDGYPRSLGPGFSSLSNLSYISFASGYGGFCSFQSNLPHDFFSNLATEKPLDLDMSWCSISIIPPTFFKYVPSIHTLDLYGNKELSIDGFEKASKGLENSTLTVLNISRTVRDYSFDSFIRKTSFQYLKHTHLKVLVVEFCYLVNIDPQAIKDLPKTVEYLSFYRNNIVQSFAFLAVNWFLPNIKTFIVSFKFKFSAYRKYSTQGRNITNFFKQEFALHHKRRTRNLRRPFNRVPFSRAKYQTVHSSNALHTKPQVSEEFCPRTVPITPFYLPSKLESLYVSGYKLLSGIPELFILDNISLRHLDFSSNGIKCFGGPIHGMPSLTYLDLSRNWCVSFYPLFLSDLTNLRTAILSQNRLGRSLAGDLEGISFSNLTLLETLDLSSNVIDTLSEHAFEKNGNIRVLNLSNNVIKKFLPSLANNRKLETLDLSSNPLEGFSLSSCTHLHNIKATNANFTVNIRGNNGFLCNCDNLYFLNFLLDRPEIFKDVTSFRCQLENGSFVSYAELAQVIPELGVHCMVQSIFVGVLLAFFLLVGSLSVTGLYHFKRWQWKYLYHIGRSRLHIGSTYLIFKPVAHVFITYDQVSSITLSPK